MIQTFEQSKTNADSFYGVCIFCFF